MRIEILTLVTRGGVFADSLTAISANNPPNEARNASPDSPRWHVPRHRADIVDAGVIAVQYRFAYA